MRDLFVIMGLLAIVAFAWAGGYVFGQMRGTSDMERELDAMREVCFRTIGIYASLRNLCRELWMKARLLDANRQIVGMRILDEYGRELEERMLELGVMSESEMHGSFDKEDVEREEQ